MSWRAWIQRLRDVVGCLAVVATLALLSPGVSLTARAESESRIADGPSCQEGSTPEQTSMRLEHWLAAVSTSAAAQPGDGGDDAVVLNNHGYRYELQRDSTPAPLEPESPSQPR